MANRLWDRQGTAQILKLSDGSRTALEIVRELNKAGLSTETENLKWIESLFVHGLLSLQDTCVASRLDDSPNGADSRRDVGRGARRSNPKGDGRQARL
jgi:hypothetical protein